MKKMMKWKKGLEWLAAAAGLATFVLSLCGNGHVSMIVAVGSLVITLFLSGWWLVDAIRSVKPVSTLTRTVELAAVVFLILGMAGMLYSSSTGTSQAEFDKIMLIREASSALSEGTAVSQSVFDRVMLFLSPYRRTFLAAGTVLMLLVLILQVSLFLFGRKKRKQQLIPMVAGMNAAPGKPGFRSASSAGRRLSENAAEINSVPGEPGFRSASDAAQRLSSNAAGMNAAPGKPGFRSASSAGRLSKNTAEINSVPGKPGFRSVSGAERRLSKNAAEMNHTPDASGFHSADSAARRLSSNAVEAGRSTVDAARGGIGTAGNAIRAASSHMGSAASMAAKIKPILATVLATTMVTTGVVTVAANPNTLPEGQSIAGSMREAAKTAVITPTPAITGEPTPVMTSTPAPTEEPAPSVTSTPVPTEESAPGVTSTPAPTEEPASGITLTPAPTEESLPTMTPEPDSTIPFAEEGYYIRYDFPVDIYCDHETFVPNEPIVFSADILGGTGPWQVEWYGWESVSKWAGDPNTPLEDYMETHPDFKLGTTYTTDQPHIEYILTMPVESKAIEMDLLIRDARGEHSDDESPNGTADSITIYSAEGWKELNPNGGTPTNDKYPYAAVTTQDHVQVRRYWGNDPNNETVTVFSQKGTQVQVIGKAPDVLEGEWLKVRLSKEQAGYVRREQLQRGGQTVSFYEPGYYSNRYFPMDVYSNRNSYRANEPMTFSADLLGGTPPFTVHWGISESINRIWSTLDQFLEINPEYQTWTEYTTEDRHITYVYTPPVNSEEMFVYLSVVDAEGVEGGEPNQEGGDTPPKLMIPLADGNANQDMESEAFPFMARTTTENVNVRSYSGTIYDRVSVIPEKGTPVKVFGKGTDSKGRKWYIIRENIDQTGWILSSLLETDESASTVERSTSQPDPAE